MPQPVICFDLDGTLVDERGEIHPRDLAILAQPGPPAVFIPCTGRLLPAVRNLFARYNLFVDVPLPFPLVLQNGAALYRPGETLISIHSFPGPTWRFFLDLILATPEITFLIFTEDQVYIQWPTEFARALTRRFDLNIQPFHPQRDIQASKIMALSAEPEHLQRIAKQAGRDGIELSFSLASALELTPAGVHKGRGLEELLKGLDLWGSPLLVAGDGGNDLSMFALTPHTFAPQTAPVEIQAGARMVIDTARSGLLGPLLAEIDRIGG